jgi:hypothetical protein
MPMKLWAQEPYAVLSEDSTVLTFYYDDQKAARNGLVYSASNQTPTINDNVKMVGEKGTSRSVLGEIKNLQENTTYYVRAYVHSSSGNYVYSPNVVTITTSPSHHEPGESDNPDPTLAPRR